MELIRPNTGYDATIETPTGIFNLRNFTDVDPDNSGIDIYDAEGKHLGQMDDESIDYPSDMEDTEQVETYMDNVVRISDFIEKQGW